MIRAAMHRRVVQGFPLLVTALLLATVSAASEDPNTQPVGETAPEITEAPLVPAVLDPNGAGLPAGPLSPQEVGVDPLEHRGGVYVDAGEPGLNALNEIERAKLDEARALVEASRAAGTLYITQLPDDTVWATPEDVSEMKLQKRATLEPQVFEHPEAGVGERLPTDQVATRAAQDSPGDRSPQPEALEAPAVHVPTEGVSDE